jgi:hypothetical protein
MQSTPRSDNTSSIQAITFGVLGVLLAFLGVVLGALQYRKMRRRHLPPDEEFEMAATNPIVRLPSELTTTASLIAVGKSPAL